ncbi:hypothetical protein R83H12_03040 [Fibrobacteria bacterium R8-3-H12]
MTTSPKTRFAKPLPKAPSRLHTSCKSLHPENPGSDVPPDNSAVRWASPTAIFFNFCGSHNSGNLGNPPPPPPPLYEFAPKQSTAPRTRTQTLRLRRYTLQTSRQTNPSKKRKSSTFAFLRPCLPFALNKFSRNILSQHCDTSIPHKNTLSQHCDTPIPHRNTLSQRCDTPIPHKNTISQGCDTPIPHRNTISQRCDTPIPHKNTISQGCDTPIPHGNIISQHCGIKNRPFFTKNKEKPL